MPSTFTVNTVADDPGGPTPGQVTLRDAINSVNSDLNPGTDTINFAITSPATGPWIIQPTQALPVITHSVFLDGTTQSGWSPGNPVIELDGSKTAGANGLEVNADNSTIQGLQVTGWANGIQIDAVSGTTVQDNVIGIVYEGSHTPLPTQSPTGNTGDGVAVGSGATNTLIGGTTSAEGNTIAGNMTGIYASSAVVVEGNQISANSGDGVFVAGGNGSFIGGTAPGAGNGISSNYGTGVVVSSANAVAILGNSIFFNDFYSSVGNDSGISLENGANNGQAAPVLNSPAYSTTPYNVPWNTWVVSGFLTGPVNTTYRIEFFANENVSYLAQYSRQGLEFLGAQTVVTNGGATPFTVYLSVPSGLFQYHQLFGSPYVTATATDPNNNTSSFSNIAGVSTAPLSPPTPVGALTMFAFGFGPGFSLDLFSVDSQGEVFAQTLGLAGIGSPVFFSPTLSLQMWGMSDGQVLGAVQDSNGQTYLIDIFTNFFNPYVQTALLDAWTAELSSLFGLVPG